VETAESELLLLMLQSRTIATQVATEGIISAFQKWGQEAAEIVAAWQQTEQIDLSVFLDRLPKALADRVTKAYGRPEREEDEDERQQLLRDCIAKIRSARGRSGREKLLQEIREAERRGDEAAVRLGLERLQK
jgi:hypothetical protein